MSISPQRESENEHEPRERERGRERISMRTHLKVLNSVDLFITASIMQSGEGEREYVRDRKRQQQWHAPADRWQGREKRREEDSALGTSVWSDEGSAALSIVGQHEMASSSLSANSRRREKH